MISSFFFYTAPASSEIYILSLHDALPISGAQLVVSRDGVQHPHLMRMVVLVVIGIVRIQRIAIKLDVRLRSEEHTSELQSLTNLVCRLLLEKKKKNKKQ